MEAFEEKSKKLFHRGNLHAKGVKIQPKYLGQTVSD